MTGAPAQAGALFFLSAAQNGRKQVQALLLSPVPEDTAATPFRPPCGEDED